MRIRKYEFEMSVSRFWSRPKFYLCVRKNEVFYWRRATRIVIKIEPKDEWEVMYLADLLWREPEFIKLQSAFFDAITIPEIKEVPIDLTKWRITFNSGLFIVEGNRGEFKGYFIESRNKERLLGDMFKVPGEFMWEEDVLKGKKIEFLSNSVLLRASLRQSRLTKKKISECRTHAKRFVRNCDKLLGAE